MKCYCAKCRDYTYHDFRRWPVCNKCRGQGHPILVWIVLLLPISAFVYAVARLAMGGSW